MEFINITGPAATQNRPSGLHCSLLYDCIVLPCCPLYFTLMLFVLFPVDFVIFSLRATILLNLNLNLNIGNNAIQKRMHDMSGRGSGFVDGGMFTDHSYKHHDRRRPEHN